MPDVPDFFDVLLSCNDSQFSGLAVRVLLILALRLEIITEAGFDRAADALQDSGQGIDEARLAVDLTGRVLDRFVAKYGRAVNESVYQGAARHLFKPPAN